MPETRRTVRLASKVNDRRGSVPATRPAVEIPNPGNVPRLADLAVPGGHASVRVEPAENGAVVTIDNERPGGPWESRRFVAGSPAQAEAIVDRALGSRGGSV